MDDKDKKIQEYLKNLPPAVQDFISKNIWEERLMEVAKKYSLNTEQGEILADTVALILVGIESPIDFQRIITQDLKISDILAEQIVKDVEIRVFEYAVKEIEKATAPKIPVVDSRLKDRAGEIGKKYSLDNNQVEKLVNLVVSIIQNPAKKVELLGTITQDLNISQILSDQIVLDLEARVFEYTTKQTDPTPIIPIPKNPQPILKSVQNPIQTAFVPSKPIQTQPRPTETKTQNTPIPEIRPNIVPMIEKGEIAHNYKKPVISTPPVSVAPKPMTQPVMSTPKIFGVITPPPAPIPPINPVIPKTTLQTEPVQRPVPVPRFTASQIDDSNSNTVSSIVNAKLSGVVKATTDLSVLETKKLDQTAPVPPPKYIDPYREPIN